jgi:opacity protein-like surface antigen
LLPDNNISQRASMLNYGWAIRHELTKNKVFTPFVGYGLFLNTLKIQDVEGGIMGHQTQFDFGTDYKISSKLKLFAKLQYSYTSYPKPEHDKRLHYQFLDVRVGVRY